MRQVSFAFFTILFILACSSRPKQAFTEVMQEKHKGVCWVGGDSVVLHNLDDLSTTGVDWISQTPFMWQDGYDSPHLYYDNKRAWWGERDAGIVHTTNLAHQKNIKVMLKPHIWIRNAKGKWRQDLEMKSKEDWDKWFSSYEEIILGFAKVAEEAKIESFCIGTELHIATTRFPDRWRSIIKNIKEIYSGELTYAANWYQEYEQIDFWDALDYIGIQAYFPLSKKDSPNVDELKEGWKEHKKKMEAITMKFNKPIIFTEVGYRNTTNSAIEPWLWPGSEYNKDVTIDDSFQADCYTAMLESFWDEDWFGGTYIWKWFHGTPTESIEEKLERRTERAKRRAQQHGNDEFKDIRFSPQGKVAQKVLQEWYKSH